MPARKKVAKRPASKSARAASAKADTGPTTQNSRERAAALPGPEVTEGTYQAAQRATH